MRLTDEEKRMLNGEYGEGTRKAMEVQVKQGEFYGADVMVPLSMALAVNGPDPGYNLANYFSDLANGGAKFRCLTYVPAADVDGKSRMAEVYRKFGGIAAVGGFGHNRNPFTYPLFGQNIIADGTGVTSFSNGIIGARANNMDAIGMHTAAIIGRAPRYGYLTPEGRRGKVLVQVEAKPKDETDWSALGFYVGWQLCRHWWDVPVFNGIDPAEVTTDKLVIFCTSLPNTGAVNHFLMVGVSPEGRTLEEAFSGGKPQETIRYGAAERRAVFDRFSTKLREPGMVSVGGWGCDTSMTTVYHVASMLEGKRVSRNFPTFVTMNPVVKMAADRAGLTKIIEAAGVYTSVEAWGREKGFENFNQIQDSRKAGIKVSVFNNTKSCHYIGQQELDAVLRNTDDCLRIALTGRIEEAV